MSLVLIVLTGVHRGKRVMLPLREVVFGRDESCELRLNFEFVSRKHCVLLRSEEGLSVTDLGSQNGTFVNDVEITSTTDLKPGDLLSIGPMDFEVMDDSRLKPEAAVPSPECQPAQTRVSSTSGRALPRVMEDLHAPSSSQETGVKHELPRLGSSPGKSPSGKMKSDVFPGVPVNSTATEPRSPQQTPQSRLVSVPEEEIVLNPINDVPLLEL